VRTTDWEDERGRRYRVRLPEGASDDQADLGIPVGPPDVVDALGLPEPLATRLHNQLHRRGVFTLADARKHPGNLTGALHSAMKIDAQLLLQAYISHEKRDPVEVSVSANGDSENPE